MMMDESKPTLIPPQDLSKGDIAETRERLKEDEPFANGELTEQEDRQEVEEASDSVGFGLPVRTD